MDLEDVVECNTDNSNDLAPGGNEQIPFASGQCRQPIMGRSDSRFHRRPPQSKMAP